MSEPAAPWHTRLIEQFVRVAPQERRAVALAFLCNFMLMGSYYILRPVRDTVATIFGSGQLQWLFTGTFIGSLIASPIYAAVAARVRIERLLPGVFWFWLANVLLFDGLFRVAPENRWVVGSYYIWFSVVNLFMISVFWSLMVDLFSSTQATRLFAVIAAGGSTGAIAGPVVTRLLVASIGLPGLLLVAAAGFIIVIVLVHLLMREKRRIAAVLADTQHSTLNHRLAGNPFDGLLEMLRSPYARSQAVFILMMSWINTIAYFFQTDLVARTFAGVAGRVQAIADISLAVNILSALVAIFGIGRYVQRFGVTAGLVLNPLMMIVAFIAVALSPSLLMIQALQVVRSVGQYAIARPSREICFTVVPQSSRYKSKNAIDTVVYRFGDLTSIWVQDGLRLLGIQMAAASMVGVGASALWAVLAARLGRSYEKIRKAGATADGFAL